MSILLFLIKLIGVTLSGLFGFLGTIHDFKNKNGSLTKWGKRAFYGIPISIFFAGLSEYLTYYSDQVTAKQASLQAVESSHKVEKIIVNLNRTLQPLKSCGIFISDIEVPMYESEFKDYKKRLDSAIQISQSTYPNLDAGVSAPSVKTNKNGKNIPLSINFSSNSIYFPAFDQRIINGVLSVENIAISIYKNLIDPKIFEPFYHGVDPIPDLNIDLYSKSHVLSSQIQPMEISYKIDDKKYVLTGTFTSDQEQWEDNSGEIISLPDLDSAQIFLSIGPLGLENSLQSKFLNLRKKFEFGSLSIEFNNTSIWINEKELLKHVSAKGSVFWEFKYKMSHKK